MILYQRHACYYSERGDLLQDRFWSMMKFDEFDDQRPVNKAQWTSQKQIRCADAQWTLDNDSQSSPASLKKLKLEEESINPTLAC